MFSKLESTLPFILRLLNFLRGCTSASVSNIWVRGADSGSTPATEQHKPEEQFSATIVPIFSVQGPFFNVSTSAIPSRRQQRLDSDVVGLSPAREEGSLRIANPIRKQKSLFYILMFAGSFLGSSASNKKTYQKPPSYDALYFAFASFRRQPSLGPISIEFHRGMKTKKEPDAMLNPVYARNAFSVTANFITMGTSVSWSNCQRNSKPNVPQQSPMRVKNDHADGREVQGKVTKRQSHWFGIRSPNTPVCVCWIHASVMTTCWDDSTGLAIPM
ncbi:hypothetical protein BDN72DRAFT_863566 [Pluteus cervinus]|uniref:Uncharacterized protein n=1 Tax=Pluteus cervinus TaxID=181527 RepID=A0ACD3A7V5_9AGAR|nr:hypothetical protein BDN72DRAFT_863566 [Pluteus cervinus]